VSGTVATLKNFDEIPLLIAPNRFLLVGLGEKVSAGTVQFFSAGVQFLGCHHLGMESSLHLQKRSWSEFPEKKQIDTGFKKTVETIESA
jgi:hypothetical protein